MPSYTRTEALRMSQTDYFGGNQIIYSLRCLNRQLKSLLEFRSKCLLNLLF